MSLLTDLIEKPLVVALAKALQRIEPDETRKTVITTLYVPVDVELEKVTDQTKTPWDDVAVDIVKEACETVAAADGFTLPNLDSD